MRVISKRPVELRAGIGADRNDALVRIARARRVPFAVVVREMVDAYLETQEPVPATPALPATPPQAIEAPTPARAGSRPSARWCSPRVVPGGRRT